MRAQVFPTCWAWMSHLLHIQPLPCGSCETLRCRIDWSTHDCSGHQAEQWMQGEAWAKEACRERREWRKEEKWEAWRGGDTVPLWCLSIYRPQKPARSIYLIFACERTAPLSRPNCTFNLSGMKERGNFSPCLSPQIHSRLNKPISRTFLPQRRLIYTWAK